TRCSRDWSADVCSSDLIRIEETHEKNDVQKSFSKIYQPKAKKKSDRFFYHGDFDPQFLHGMLQVRKAYQTAVENAPEPEEGKEQIGRASGRETVGKAAG